MKFLIAVFALVICSSCVETINSQQINTPQDKPIALSVPDGWVLYPDSKIDDAALRCGNYSRREWRVEQGENNVSIRLDEVQDHQDVLPSVIDFRKAKAVKVSSRSVEQVDDGWLVGLDIGEFGGGLWWFSSDGKVSKKLSEENIVRFAKTSSGVFALAGLAHLGINDGKILKIVGGGINRKVEKLLDLGATPRAFVMESADTLLILTTDSLVRVKTSGTIEKLFSTRYWQLYPTSMIVSPSGIVHIGMNHFVVRLTPTGKEYKEEWFVPRDCTKFKIRDGDCVCTKEKQL